MRRTGVVIEIGHVVAWLIAMRILTDHASNVGRHVRRHLRTLIEELIELRNESLLAAQHLDQQLRIMLDAERRLPGVSLGIVAPFAA